MPSNRTRRRRNRNLTALTPAAEWWLEHGGYMSHEEAARLEIPGGALETWVLNGCDETMHTSKRPLWTRRRLRDAGYGEAIDALIEAGKAPPDDCFRRG